MGLKNKPLIPKLKKALHGKLYGITGANIKQAILGVQNDTTLGQQVAGNHYKSMVIQPVEFCQKNQLRFCESSAIKYICRHRSKNGAEDIRKAIHFLELLLELEYANKPGIDTNFTKQRHDPKPKAS